MTRPHPTLTHAVDPAGYDEAPGVVSRALPSESIRTRSPAGDLHLSRTRRIAALLDEQHLFRLAPVADGNPVEVDTRCDRPTVSITAVPDCRVPSGLHVRIQKRADNRSPNRIDGESHGRAALGGRHNELDRCKRVEWIRDVLFQKSSTETYDIIIVVDAHRNLKAIELRPPHVVKEAPPLYSGAIPPTTTSTSPSPSTSSTAGDP